MADLFAFESGVCSGANPSMFPLVTRFPRRVFALRLLRSSLDEGGGVKGGGGCDGHYDANPMFKSMGICQGQKMFMVKLL
jgi:hypothetical protein